MSVKHLTTETFNDTVNSGLSLVDFWAAWCMPCKMVAPVIDELAEQYKDRMTVAKVDIDAEESLADKYGVHTIPTVILFKDGVEQNRLVGVQPIQAYQAAIGK